MGTFSWQTWNSSPFNIERKPGKSPGTVILRFCGPFTIRDAYSSLPPGELNRILGLEPAPGEAPPKLNILDLTTCPYMDSSGLGIIATHYVRCQKQGLRMIAAGLSPKVRDVFRITKMDKVIPIAATVEEAEIN
jgi:anti-sigma B factor antagonist